MKGEKPRLKPHETRKNGQKIREKGGNEPETLGKNESLNLIDQIKKICKDIFSVKK